MFTFDIYLYTYTLVQSLTMSGKINIRTPILDVAATNKKTKELLVYLIKEHPNPSITVLMKLCYLIDLVAYKQSGNQITNFEYTRYTFGPFDKKIYSYIEELSLEGRVIQKPTYNPRNGDEYIVFETKDDFEVSELKNGEKEIVDSVLDDVSGYGANVLTQIAYKTKPMKKLGATLGGSESIGEKLDFDAK